MSQVRSGWCPDLPTLGRGGDAVRLQHTSSENGLWEIKTRNTARWESDKKESLKQSKNILTDVQEKRICLGHFAGTNVGQFFWRPNGAEPWLSGKLGNIPTDKFLKGETLWKLDWNPKAMIW